MSNMDNRNKVFIKIGNRIQYYRNKANLKQDQLAERISISQKHLSRIEQGYHNPHFDIMISLAKELDVPIDAFLEDVEDNQVNTFLQIMKSDISSMSKKQLEMLKRYIELIKEFDF